MSCLTSEIKNQSSDTSPTREACKAKQVRPEWKGVGSLTQDKESSAGGHLPRCPSALRVHRTQWKRPLWQGLVLCGFVYRVSGNSKTMGRKSDEGLLGLGWGWHRVLDR